jgi:RNA polymerase sigma-70 factor (ECF subfamily)
MAEPTQSQGLCLEKFRAYLRLLARLQVDPRIRAKIDPSDAVQETLLRAYQHLDEFRGRTEQEITAWLRTTLANCLKDVARKFGREKADVARERSLEAALEHSSMRLEAWLADDQSSPPAKAIRNETMLRFAEGLEQLPESERLALELRYLDGFSVAEAAKHLGRTKAATAGLIHRAFMRLRESFPDGP